MLIVVSTLRGSFGGIPAFNRLLVEAAAEFCAQRRQSLRVLALTDDGKERIAGLDYLPCEGDRRRLLRAYLAELGRPLPLLLGHVNLAPLGLLWPRSVGVIAHGSEVFAPLPPLRRLGLRRATAVACVSDYTAGCAQKHQGLPATRILRVVNALPSLPTNWASQGTSGGPLRLLAICRLHPDEKKGIDSLLRALARLPSDEFTLTVIGDGPARPTLQGLADQLGVAAQVRFLGAVPDAARDAELRACDVFALPSELEGFGIVYAEALAHGKPCLAAQAGGAPEIVRDGETGLLCPAPVAENLDALCAALQRLRDPALRQRLGQTGRAFVEQHHTRPAFVAAARVFFARLSRDG